MARERFVFDGNDLTEYLTVSNVTRTILPSRRLNRQELPGRDGELVSAYGMDALEVEVTCNLRANTVADVSRQRRLLSAALMAGSVAPLILPDEPHLWTRAIYEGGAEMGRNAHKPEVKLTFLLPDPVAYGEEREVSFSGSVSLNVGGTLPALPVITARPTAGSGWRVTNSDTGEHVEVERRFAGTETVVVDMGLARCTVDGVDVAVTLASDFFSVTGAAQLIEVSGGSASVSWVERWA